MDRTPDPDPVSTALNRPALRHGLILALCAAALVAAGSLRVEGRTRVVLPVLGHELPGVCLWKRWLGVSCPGCGLTRSVTCLAHGQVARAQQFHAAGWAVFAWLLLQIPYRAVNLWRCRRRRDPLGGRWMVVANWAVLISIFVL